MMTHDELKTYADGVWQDNRARGVETLRPQTREKLLKIASQTAPKRILELGTAEGATALSLLAYAPKSFLVTVELSEDRALTARKHFAAAGVDHRVRAVYGDILEVVPALSEPFDLILLDGPKGAYSSLLTPLLSLLNPKGVLFADDVLFHGYVTGETEYRSKHGAIIRSLRAFLEEAEKLHGNGYTVERCDIEDGVLILTKQE